MMCAVQAFRKDSSGWTLEPIQGVVRSLRAAAQQADKVPDNVVHGRMRSEDVPVDRQALL